MTDKEIFSQPPVLTDEQVAEIFKGVVYNATSGRRVQRDDTERNMIKQFAVELKRIVVEDPLPEGIIAFIVALQKAGER